MAIHLFSVYAQMRLLTLEPSLVAQSFDRNPRFEVAATIALESTKQGGKLVCFMDVGNASEEVAGTRKKRAGPDAYDLLKSTMVHAGIPPEWIAIVTGDRVKGSKRQAIADEYNAGKVRIIIGSTGTIGEGFDLQVGTTDLIHLDIPWDPGTFHQRVGRGHRQGNFSNLLRNHILLARGSFDGLTYAMMRGKRGWQQQLWHSGEDRSRNSAVLSYDEILAALSDDPDKARLEIEQQRANIEAQKLEQRRQMGLAQFRLYLETLDHQTLAWQRAVGRKNGPTANDHKLKGNFERQLERYRQALTEDSSFGHTDLLDGRICLLTSSGMILAAGVKFSITEAEKLFEYRVESLGFRHNDDGKWVKAVGLEPDGSDGNVRIFHEADLERLKVTMFTPGLLEDSNQVQG
jgi:superfamily II DNA/RNA helicase